MVLSIAARKGQDHRVLFQNAEGTINMGVWFDDPEIEKSDIFWYNHLGNMINNSLAVNEGLCFHDKNLGIKSCYVELHRTGLLKNYNQKFRLKLTIFVDR